MQGNEPRAPTQAEVAAENLLGGSRAYEGTLPVTMLKVVGVQLTSIGRIEQVEGDDVVALEATAEHAYRKLVIDELQLLLAQRIGDVGVALGRGHAATPVRSRCAPARLRGSGFVRVRARKQAAMNHAFAVCRR